MRLSATIIFCCLVMAGCRSEEKLPSDILPREKMQAVVWDMMRADQFLSTYVHGRDSTLNKDSTSIRAYQRVLAVHNLQKEDFAKSFAYYKAHPALMKQIMDSLSRPVSVAPTQKVVPDEVPPAGEERIVVPGSDTAIRRPPSPVN